MKTLFSTTALVVALGFPSVMLAEATQPAAATTKAQTGTEMQGFLATRGQSDLFASELVGHAVYARRAPADMTKTTGQATMNADGTQDFAAMKRTDLESMDNIGQVNEIILSNDGKVRAIVIGVGGFLGLGERDVAVTMDQVTFATDPDDRSEMYVVVNTNADMLKTSPAYDRVVMTGENAQRTGAATDRTAFTAPKIARDGYTPVVATDVSAEMLVGKSVYGLNDDSVGTIDDLIVDEKGKVANVIIDFGGFLGMGTSQVSVGFDELTILTDKGRTDVRVYVDATKDQIQAQPKYQAVN